MSGCLPCDSMCVEWQDLRILLAVARTGSVVAAGRELAVAHTTVSRRLAALEQDRPALFVRTGSALVPTPEGEALLERARGVESAMQALDRRIADLSGRLEGTVRVATNLPWGERLVAALGRLRERAPGLTLHVQISNALVDLARHEADVAVRGMPPGRSPGWSNVVARKLVSAGFALFGSPRYFERRGEQVRPIEDLAGHDVVTYGGNFPWQPGAALLEAAGARVHRAMTTNHPHGAIEAAAAGIGLVVVPCFLGHARGLVQLTSPLDHEDVYVAFAADMQDVPRVRAVIDAIVEAVRADLEQLQGRAIELPVKS
jgi:DNA-binding transcriptional LysR family regulator